MSSMNQTRPHCVDQMGKTHSKLLAALHGRGTAWARHVMCESAFILLTWRVWWVPNNASRWMVFNSAFKGSILQYCGLRGKTELHIVAHDTFITGTPKGFATFNESGLHVEGTREPKQRASCCDSNNWDLISEGSTWFERCLVQHLFGLNRHLLPDLSPRTH